MPTSRAGTSPRIAAKMVSSAVTGSLSASSWVRLRPVRKDVPRSPLSSLPIQRTYCTGGGSSRPYDARMLAMSCALARVSGPRITLTGSPGTSRMSENVTRLTPSRTGITSVRRARRYLRTRYAVSPRRPHARCRTRSAAAVAPPPHSLRRRTRSAAAPPPSDARCRPRALPAEPAAHEAATHGKNRHRLLPASPHRRPQPTQQASREPSQEVREASREPSWQCHNFRASVTPGLFVEPDVPQRVVGARGDVRIALDVRLHRFELVGDVQVDPRHVVKQLLLQLLVDLLAFGLVRGRGARGDELVRFGAAVAHGVTGHARAEVAEIDVVGIDVGARAGHGQIEVVVEVVLDVGGVFFEVDIGADADLLQLLLDHDRGVGQE